MRKLYLLLLIVSIHSLGQLYAQAPTTQQQIFEEGLSEYFSGEEIFNDEELFLETDDLDLAVYYFDAIELFNKITDSGDLGKSAKYYKLLCDYRLAVMDYEYELDSSFYEAAKDLVVRFDHLTSNQFPFYYNYQGKRFVVNYSNFEFHRNDLYYNLFVTTGKLKKFPESLDYARKSYSFTSNSALNKFIALLFIGVSKEQLKQFDLELAENGVRFIEAYNNLSDADKALASVWVEKNSVADVGWDQFQKSASLNPTIKGNSQLVYALASGLNTLGDLRSTDAFKMLLETNQPTDEHLLGAVEYGLLNNTELANAASNLLLERKLTCSDYGRLSQTFGKLNLPDKAKLASTKEEECKKKLARIEKREQNGRTRFFAGIHPGQYLRGIENRDPGAVLGVISGKKMTALSFSKVVNDPYQMLDLYLNDITVPGFHPKWDGYRAGISFRTRFENFENKTWNYYYGFQFSYANEKLQQFTDEVTNIASNLKSTVTFSPIDQSYRLYYNLGSTYYWYFLGIDLNLNLGLSLNTFDLNNPNYKFNAENQFTNPLLEFRKRKEFHYGSLIQINLVTYIIM